MTTALRSHSLQHSNTLQHEKNLLSNVCGEKFTDDTNQCDDDKNNGTTLQTSQRYRHIIHPKASRVSRHARNRPARHLKLIGALTHTHRPSSSLTHTHPPSSSLTHTHPPSSSSLTHTHRPSSSLTHTHRPSSSSSLTHTHDPASSLTHTHTTQQNEDALAAFRSHRSEFGIATAANVCKEPLRVCVPNTMKTVPSLPKTHHHHHHTHTHTHNGDDVAHQQIIIDFITRAQACHRAGRTESEAQVCFNIGTLYEQQHNDEQALIYYKKHLDISVLRNDSVARALAYNAIGSVLQKQEHYEDSLKFHRAHLHIADKSGQFVAHTNIGLVQQRIGQHDKALVSHQNALRYAIRIESSSAHAIALANIGACHASSGDVYTGEVCIQRFLQLSSENNDKSSQMSAYETLGLIACKQGQLKQAKTLLEQSRKNAQALGDRKHGDKLGVNIGVVCGDLLLEQHMHAIQMRLKSTMN